MIKSSIMSPSTELRKLKPGELYMLGTILSVSNSWKKLMGIIPKSEYLTIPKFNSEDISIVERAAREHERNAAEIFLDEWSTMGKKRPTLGRLLELLIKAELFRAADYVACDLLKQEKPKRPNVGPAAVVDTSDSVINKLLEDQMRLEDSISLSISGSVMSESTAEAKDGNEKLPLSFCELHKVIEDLPDIADPSSNREKPTSIAEDRSDLIKFSTDTCEALHGDTDYTLTSASDQFLPKPIANIGKDTSSSESSDPKLDTPPNTMEQHGYEEVPSQELPLSVRKHK